MGEKYGLWRDGGTGIHPFLPFNKQTPASKPSSLLLPIRLLLLLLLIPAAFVSTYLFGRLCLYTLGFWHIEHSLEQKKVKNIESADLSVRNGDVLISNHISYIDILYFSYKYNPQFVKPTPQGKFIPMNAYQYIQSMGKKYSTANQGVPFTELPKNKPIMIFPEGTTTNGKGALLNFLPVFTHLEKSRVHVFCLKYPYQQFNPAYICGSIYKHLLVLLCQVSNSLVVKRLPVILPNTTTDLSSDVEKGMCAMGKLTRVRMGVEEFNGFYEYYTMREKGNSYKKKKK